MSEQTMPANVEAEKAILGAVLLDKGTNCYNQAAMALQTSDFSLDSHRRIWTRMVELYESGSPIDFLTLSDQLGQHQEIESVGGVSYVTSLTEGALRLQNIGEYVRRVKGKATLRQIIHLANGASHAAYSQETPASHILGVLQENLLTILGDERKGSAAKVSEFSGETWQKLTARRNSDNRLVGFSTGIDPLDRRTTGIRRGEFWTVGGRTGDGKTSLALQIAAASASVGIPVGFFSLEMDRDSLLERLWSAHGKIDYAHIRTPNRLNEMEAMSLAGAKDEVDKWPLFIEDEPAYSVGEIEARARLMVRQHEVGLIIVDYLQIVDAPGKEERHRLTKISKSLRMLAKSENIGVVGLSQMPRPASKDMNKRPNKFDLKESGSIENDSHTVLLIFRPVDDCDQYIGKDEIVIGKQRSGETGVEPMVYMGKYMSFEPRAF